MTSRILSLLALALIAVLASCNKSSSNNTPPPPPPGPTYFFKAKIDGTLYEGSHSLASHMVGDKIAIGSIISFQGQQTPFTVWIDSFNGPRNYSQNETDIIVGETDYEGFSNFFYGTATSRIISDGGAKGTVLKGEFCGTLFTADSSEMISVTEGSFEAKWSN